MDANALLWFLDTVQAINAINCVWRCDAECTFQSDFVNVFE
jgi:hypothetical protein